MDVQSTQLFIKKPNVHGVYGKHPSERTIEEKLNYAIINLDKPKGPTSHQVSSFIQKILTLGKAGHSGTLDPQVTGVQPIAIGRATRIAEYLLKSPKEYICLMHIHQIVPEERIHKTAKQFSGKIIQLPPIKSAVKRQLRTREIYELEIIEIKEKDILFRCKCQAGTYIRKLCHDWGQAIGPGAHMAELRRTQAGPFRENDHLITLNDLQEAIYYYHEKGDPTYLNYILQPVENALTYLKKCYVQDSAILSLTNGRDLGIPGIVKLENFPKGEAVAVMSLKNELIAIGTATLSAVQINSQTKGIAIKIEKVFMESPKTPNGEKTTIPKTSTKTELN